MSWGLPDPTDQWRDEMADLGFTEEQIQGIVAFLDMETETMLSVAADTLEEAGWTVTPPHPLDGGARADG